MIMFKYLPIDSKSFRRMLLILFTLSLIFITISYFFSSFVQDNINKSILKQNTYTYARILEAGDVKSIGPDIFNRTISNTSYKRAEEILSEYGIDSSMSGSILPALKNFKGNLFGLLVFIVLFIFFICVLMLTITYRQYNKHLQLMCVNTEKIMDGDFNILYPEDGEEEMHKLGFLLNQMSFRLKSTLDKLHEEKVYLQDMISGISHQLKTPLSTLRVCSDSINEEIEKNMNTESYEALNYYINKSQSQLDRMEWLIKSLLKVSRLEAGMIELNIESRDIVATLIKAEEAITDRIKQKQQSFIIEGKPTAPCVVPHDEKWMLEALLNLIKNASDYTPQGGSIRAEVNNLDTCIEIRISDNGPGIPSEEIPLIFKKFYRVKKKASQENETGSGIGLSITKAVIELHGGFIRMDSQSHKGATFIVTLLTHPILTKL